jgi:hypothetical protein
MHTFARTGLVAALALAAATSFSQSAVQQTVPSSAVDTARFFPQIQEVLLSKPFKVSQGHLSTDEQGGRPNSLRAGGLFGESSIEPGAFFPGITQSGWTPGDPDLAVGTNHIVEVINAQIAFFTKAGVKQFQQSSNTFFSGMGAFNFQFDPKVSYDRVHNRFVLVFLERDTSAGNVSKILVAVSDDGDPNGTWHRYRIEAKLNISGADYWLDYPGLGYNKDAYLVNGNMFAFSSGPFGGVQFLVMPSAPMLVGAPVTVTSLRHASGGSAQAADVMDPNEPNCWAVSRSGNSGMRVYAIQNLLTTPTFVSTTVTVPTNAGPAGDAESTNGTFLDVIDARVYNAVWRGGRILTAHNIEGTNFVASRWYELNVGTWPTSGTVSLIQSGNINSTSFNYFCPAINKNATGKISSTFTRSSTSVTADFALSTRKPGDPLGTMGAPVVLTSSVGNNYTQNRWGDYFCIDVDPVDDVTFWGVHMIVAANNSFTTEIRSWTVPAVVQQPATSYSWFRGTPVSGNLASLVADDADYLVGRAGFTLSPAEPPAQLEVETFSQSPIVYGIDFNLIAKVNTPGLEQHIEAWNFVTNQWTVLGQAVSTTIDSGHMVSVGGNVQEYVQSGTGRIRFKVSWFRTGLTLLWPWSVSVDQAQFSVNGA